MSILIENISKSFNGNPVLDSVSLIIPMGKITAILGPSGTGKTTLLRLIAELDKPDRGFIKGVSQKDTAYMFQESRLFPWMTALENIACVIHKKNTAALKEAAEWLEKVKLTQDGNKYPSELSGGMNRRTALARTLAYRKSLILLDEPFYGLDAGLKSEIITMTGRETIGKTVIFITHDLTEAESFSDNIIYLNQAGYLSEASQAPF